MNEGRRVERLRVLGESLPIVDTFIFAAPLLSAIFHCLPLWFRRRPFARSSRSYSYRSRVRVILQDVSPGGTRGLVSRYPTRLSRVIWFPGTAKRFFRNSRNTLRSASLLPGRWKSRADELQMQLDSWLHEKNSAGWSDVSAECMHSKCIGSRTHIRFLRGRQNVRHYRKEKRRAAILDHHWHVNITI